MILHWQHNDIPPELHARKDVTYWAATDPQLELWATDEETWYIKFQQEQEALLWLLKYPDLTSVVQEQHQWL